MILDHVLFTGQEKLGICLLVSTWCLIISKWSFELADFTHFSTITLAPGTGSSASSKTSPFTPMCDFKDGRSKNDWISYK
jgi:hypothetical protein